MHIAIVHSFYSSAAPSGENLAVDLQADALRTAGHQVSIVCARTDELAQAAGYKLRTTAGLLTGTGQDPAPRLRALSPDIVHVHNLFPNFATRWLRNWSGPVVATIHNYRPMCAAGTLAREGSDCFECVGRRLPLPALRHRCYRDSLLATVPLAATQRGVNRHPLLRRADGIVMLADRAIRLYERAGLERMHRVSLVPNFVESPTATRSVSPDSRWVYVSRLSKEKGILPLLRNWPRDIPLDVWGDGPQRSEAETLASENIRVRGPLPRGKVLELLPRARGLVFPSMFSEGLPTIYLECLAAGTPVLARAGNSAADDIREHQTGRVFTDMSNLRGHLSAVDSNMSLYSRNAVARYQNHFSMEAWLDRICNVYSRAAQTNPMQP